MKVAITGGAAGIGGATVELMIAKGWEVTVFGRTKPENGQSQFIHCDIGDDSSIENALNSTNDGYDALVSNAGLPPKKGLESEILSVNFFGLRKFAHAFEAKLNRGGAFVHVASRAGAKWRTNMDLIRKLFAVEDRSQLETFVAAQEMSAMESYQLSKGAVLACVAFETERLLAKGLRINSISPAATNTGMLKNFLGTPAKMVENNIGRIGRAGNPCECAEVISFLASPESSWVKGVSIPVDGGLSAMILADALGPNKLKL